LIGPEAGVRDHYRGSVRRVFGSNGRDDQNLTEPAGGNGPATTDPAVPDLALQPHSGRAGGSGYSELAEQIHRRMIQMFAIVEEAVAGATDALLTGDRERARALVASDAALDELYIELQRLVHDRVVAGGLDAGETTWLLAVLSMLPELERSGDLAEHVAQRATRNLPAEIPARMRGYIERMGELACSTPMPSGSPAPSASTCSTTSWTISTFVSSPSSSRARSRFRWRSSWRWSGVSMSVWATTP